MKAFLEIDMPDNCVDCEISLRKAELDGERWFCPALHIWLIAASLGRVANCPLKPVAESGNPPPVTVKLLAAEIGEKIKKLGELLNVGVATADPE